MAAGCRQEGIIPPDDMASMLADFYMADACLEVSSQAAVKYDNHRIYEPIVESYGYDKEIFRASMDWYLHHPDKFEKIFKRTHAKLKQLDSDAAKLIEHDEEEVLAHPRMVEEGAEPDIEAPAISEGPEGPGDVEKPVRKPKAEKRQKKMTKKDLKRIRKELEEAK